jgi:predicted membrane protein
MLVRLGHALYWLCCLLAAIIVVFGIVAWFDRFSATPNGLAVMLVFAAAAAIVWGLGRACRYVLSGN